MNKIKSSFLIQDLEILSGIKAHTLRIWEKRYDLLQPNRLNRNIRTYSLEDLQKLLNVSILYNNGQKISKLAKLSQEELFESAQRVGLESISNNYAISSLIIAMYSFDSASFEKIYLDLSKKVSFEELFIETYIPLLNQIGVLWQTNAIKPIHEHFISNLIYQKILLNTALIRVKKKSDDLMNVLFLPEGEMHSLGLVFLNYCLLLRGENTVFLGGEIPFSNLELMKAKYSRVRWICSFVIDKTVEEKNKFIENLSDLLKNADHEAVLVGSIWDNETYDIEGIKFFSNFNTLPFL